MPGKVTEVGTTAGDQVVDAGNPVTLGEQPIDQMAADEACRTGDNDMQWN